MIELPVLRGGAWLLEPQQPSGVFTPERMTEEHRLVARTVSDLVEQEIVPAIDRLEQKDWALARTLMQSCGTVGILGVDVDEADGGIHADTVTSMLVSERMCGAASFSVTFGAQLNLVILPLSLFGTPEQKQRYLPGLLSGELIGAYCLSESGSGSDALGAKTRAVRQADGSFVLTGEKMWTTNGGIADIFIVFAKVDGEHFTAFIVERAFEGVTSGKEEHKMGLHGSSTTAVRLDRVRVPADNILGEVGKGHKVAFNVLNFGRFKLGATCGGTARLGIGEAARYAAQRKQFGQPIASFGAIRHKLGEMIAGAYAVESLNYRIAGLIDARMGSASRFDPRAAVAAFEEHAIEASISKVASSEVLDFILDENIQIHGGNGYVHDYPAERHYRDSRVNRIFEGTNEINRLLIPGIFARRVPDAFPELFQALTSARLEETVLDGSAIGANAEADSEDDSPLGPESATVDRCRKAALLVLGCALKTYGQKLQHEQEVLTHAADMLIDLFAADSAVLRARAAASERLPRAALHLYAARLFVSDAAVRIESAARQALAAMLEGETLETTLDAVHALVAQRTPANTVLLRRALADEAVARGSYPFSGQ